MNPTGAMFGGALALCALAAVAALTLPRSPRPAVVAVLTCGAGAAGVAAGIWAMTGREWACRLPGLLPLAGVRLAIDPLGGLFVAVTGAVAICAAVYGVGYARHGLDGRVFQALVPAFVAALLLVPAAAGVSTFLVAWELMAVTSLLLLVAEHRRRGEVVTAGVWYAVMTHLGLVVILAGLAGYAAAAGGESFAQLRAAELPAWGRTAVFAATFLGFGSKAGMVPLHVWLPRAHPEAPSHVSALMSAAMVNLGVYGIVRVDMDLLGGGSSWWWLLVLAAGMVSALYGILQAVVATDLKRLLAYSTCENMGLVLIGVGAAGLFATHGARPLAALALTAGLLHVVNHAAFKTVLFLSAGSVVHATGSRDLDALGGLGGRMPVTTALFGIGALAASALPPGNGFVSEWLLLQSLIHVLPGNGPALAVALPLAVAVVALSAGLAIATFVKAFGTGFLARARTPAAETATECPRSMRAGMALAASCCLVLAVVPSAALPGVVSAAGTVLPGPEAVSGEVTLRVAGAESTLSPLVMVSGLALAVLALAVLAPFVAMRRARRRARLWDCGMGPMSPRMEYTATSFAEPLQRVFDNVLAPDADLDVTPVKESAYLVEAVTYRTRVDDRIEHRFYRPVIAAADRLGSAARGLATGSVHRYLAYGFYAFTALLVVLAVTR